MIRVIHTHDSSTAGENFAESAGYAINERPAMVRQHHAGLTINVLSWRTT